MEHKEGGFKVGDIVEHVLNKDYLLVLKKGREQYLCRTKSMEEIWVYDFELKDKTIQR